MIDDGRDDVFTYCFQELYRITLEHSKCYRIENHRIRINWTLLKDIKIGVT